MINSGVAIRTVKVIGSGSAGIHHAHAARRLGWSVDICDVDPAALTRARDEIFPARYGAWDSAIRLFSLIDAPADPYDLICIATPPDSHVALARDALDAKPKAILIEKPLCEPTMDGVSDLVSRAEAAKIPVFVGYDHAVGAASRKVETILKADSGIGHIHTIDVEFREHWSGIFLAHPWLRGPEDTYLGYWRRGGGASGEHSHATNLWQHFARIAGVGRVAEVSATLDYVRDGATEYDRMAAMTFRTDKGLVGRAIQDVITSPARKWARIQGDTGYIEWHCGYEPGFDAVTWAKHGQDATTEKIAKTRPDDFIEELSHIATAVAGGYKTAAASPLSLAYGLETIRTVVAAHESARRKAVVTIAGLMRRPSTSSES
ncbi:MAG: Gfo/Idh/MocA family oxidoreductase [Rhodospirillales bacterium]|nr:Gfo/Idh/MocA family oxidoreductase [Rhodospirillales bacterium]